MVEPTGLNTSSLSGEVDKSQSICPTHEEKVSEKEKKKRKEKDKDGKDKSLYEERKEVFGYQYLNFFSLYFRFFHCMRNITKWSFNNYVLDPLTAESSG